MIAALPAALGAEPPDWLKVPFEVAFELIDTRMPSIDSCERLVLVKALVKLVAEQLSKELAGNDVNLEQLRHVVLKLVPLLVSNLGNDVNPEQPFHAPWKIIPLLVSNSGNDVNPVQPFHA